MKFDELVEKLLESTSPLRLLYHTTYLIDIEQLVKTDEFKCGENDLSYNFNSKEPEIFKKYPYFMSVARTHNNAFLRSISRNNFSNVTLVLDAVKLSDHGYPIKPINFYKRSDKQESEDRVLSKTKTIPNFNEYIKEFHVFVTPADLIDINRSKQNQLDFEEWLNTMRRTGKPCYRYITLKDFLSLNRTKREPL